MPETTIVEKLYGLYQNGAVLTHISDNTKTLQNIAKSNDEILEIDTDSPDISADPSRKHIEDTFSFDIIQNDKDKQYGFSETYLTDDNKYRMTVWKTRLNKDLYENDVQKAIEDLTENPAIWNDYDNSLSAVNAHCEYWNIAPVKTDNIHVFHLSDEMLRMLLTTGFESQLLMLG